MQIITAGRLKCLLTMKLLILFTIIACVQASARSYGQTVSLSLQNAPLEKAFKEIKRQTGYSFVYTRAQLKNTIPITYQVANGSLKDVLEQCFRNQPLSFVIEDKYIVVQTKTVPTQTSVTVTDPIDITGRVVNENGEAVVGASVKVKGTNVGTSTNENGDFKLTVPAPDVTLIITSINIESLEITLNGRTVLSTIIVNTSIKALSTVVVNKGYYTTTQKLNTGSVSKISSGEIEKQPVSNPISALQGRVPGLLITQRNGLPGSNMTIRIRGQNSIQQGNEPLFIVDGVPFSSENMDRTGILLNATSPFNTINPSDIESIEILKDADATAIYGSRGANGVVLITTKKAKPGKTSINVNFFTGWSNTTRTMNYMNTSQYIEMRKEAFRNDAATPNIANAPDLLLWDTSRYIDWKKRILGNTSNTTNAQVRISGGSKNINYYLSTSYYTEGTVFPGTSKYRRGSTSFNVSTLSADSKFSLVISSSYTFDKNSLPPQDISIFITNPPNMYEPYDSTGRLRWHEGGFSYGNSFSYLYQQYSASSGRLIANANLSYKILDKLIIRSNFNFNSVQYDQYSTRPIASQNPAFNPRGSATFYNSSSKIWNIEPQIDYSTSLLKKGTLQVLVGSSWQQKKDNGVYLTGSGYTNDAQITSIAGAGTISVQHDYTLYRFSSIYSRVNYNWNDRYLINVVARQDASTRFGPANRLAKFGALGLSWIFSSEKVIETKFKALSFGKLRASIGTTGNDRIGDYQYLDTWSNTLNSYQGQTGLRPTRLFNENYGWEQIRKINIGLELGFFNDRIFLVADLFRHRSDNQLLLYSLPDQTGFTSVIRNIPGVVQNKGVELLINTTNIRKTKFLWRSSFNLTVQRNKLIEFYNLQNSSHANRYIIGKPLNLFFGYTYLGVDQQTGI
jgi:TonB-linked SusC/RagA family outer membrane protein